MSDQRDSASHAAVEPSVSPAIRSGSSQTGAAEQAPGSGDVGQTICDIAGLEPREAIERLNCRASALARLLDPAHDRPYAAAVEALAMALAPRAAGVALMQPDAPELKIEAAWIDGTLQEPSTWNLDAGVLRDLAASGDDGWTGTLSHDDIPFHEHVQDLDAADVVCNALYCRGAFAGFVFCVHAAGEGASPDGADAVARLVSSHLSSRLDLAEERKDQALTRQQFRDIAELSFDWFWEMDADFRIVHLSQQWFEIAGVDAEDVTGRTFEEIGISTSGTRWGRFVQTLAKHGEVHGFDARVIDSHGRYHYWKINGRAFHSASGTLLGYRGSCTDVTAEVEQRSRAEKAERLLNEAIAALPQGFVLFDEDDRLVVCNDQFRMLFPEVESELVAGGDFLDITRTWAERTAERPPGMDVEELVARRVRAHREPEREREAKRADGRICLVQERKTRSGSSVWLHTDITSIKERELELAGLGEVLRTRNHHFDVTINSISDGLLMVSSARKLVLCNERWREMFAVPDELCREGTDVEDLVAYFQKAGFAPQLETTYQRKWDTIRKAGELTYSWELPDGRLFEITAVATQDEGILVAYRDITLAARQSAVLREQATEFETLSQALAQQNAYFDGALNSMVQALATFDPQDRLIVCNKRFQEILGLPDKLTEAGAGVAEIGRFMQEAGLMDDAAGRVARTHQKAREEGRVIAKMRFHDGRVFEVQNLLLENDDVLVTFHEITAVEQHARRLNEYAERLEYSNRELEEFAYVASHDLQEPLRKIEAFSDRLRQKYGDRLDENGRAYLERMQHASRRMRSLISDLLDYSRINTKPKPFALVDLGTVIDGVLADLEIALEASDAEVSVSDMPCLEVDASQMQRLFQNLISNAVKFRKPDEAPAIRIDARAERPDGGPAMHRIVVCDNGIGFDNRHAEQVFKIFHRLHGRADYEGTGIGLATCRKIVERHHGTILASSEPGVGTTITITLPTRQLNQKGTT